MKQEFITTHGNVVIERDKIFIMEEEHGSSARSIYFFVFIVLQIASRVLNVPEMKWVALIFGLLGTIHFVHYLFKHKNQSSKTRILISQVNNITVDEDQDGIDKWVKLHLSSGKIRYIKFRKQENQYQPFIEAVSQQIFLHQSAA